MLDTVKNAPVNGLDLAALGEMVEAIEKDAGKAKVGFDVTTRWTGQTRSETIVDGFTIAGERDRPQPQDRRRRAVRAARHATARPTRRSC